MINHPKLGGGKDDSANVTVRGVSGKPFGVRPSVHVIEGKRFTPGSSEVIVGKSISRRIADCHLGGVIRQGGTDWKVVGVFDAGGSAFESEIWGDAEVMLAAFDRGVFQSVTLRLRDPDADLKAIDETFAKDQRLKSLQVQREDIYYAKQSELIEQLITGLGSMVTFIMFLGAIMGAMNTMYAAVAGRTREIATLLAIGFGPGSVFFAFLLESLFLCALGGAVAACSHCR
ncbi:MAG: ABC transporter permease [Planctomycetota bacterium]